MAAGRSDLVPSREDVEEEFEERAAIFEYDAGYERDVAEELARMLVEEKYGEV